MPWETNPILNRLKHTVGWRTPHPYYGANKSLILNNIRLKTLLVLHSWFKWNNWLLASVQNISSRSTKLWYITAMRIPKKQRAKHVVTKIFGLHEDVADNVSDSLTYDHKNQPKLLRSHFLNNKSFFKLIVKKTHPYGVSGLKNHIQDKTKKNAINQFKQTNTINKYKAKWFELFATPIKNRLSNHNFYRNALLKKRRNYRLVRQHRRLYLVYNFIERTWEHTELIGRHSAVKKESETFQYFSYKKNRNKSVPQIISYKIGNKKYYIKRLYETKQKIEHLYNFAFFKRFKFRTKASILLLKKKKKLRKIRTRERLASKFYRIPKKYRRVVRFFKKHTYPLGIFEKLNNKQQKLKIWKKKIFKPEITKYILWRKKYLQSLSIKNIVIRKFLQILKKSKKQRKLIKIKKALWLQATKMFTKSRKRRSRNRMTRKKFFFRAKRVFYRGKSEKKWIKKYNKEFHQYIKKFVKKKRKKIQFFSFKRKFRRFIPKRKKIAVKNFKLKLSKKYLKKKLSKKHLKKKFRIFRKKRFKKRNLRRWRANINIFLKFYKRKKLSKKLKRKKRLSSFRMNYIFKKIVRFAYNQDRLGYSVVRFLQPLGKDFSMKKMRRMALKKQELRKYRNHVAFERFMPILTFVFRYRVLQPLVEQIAFELEKTKRHWPLLRTIRALIKELKPPFFTAYRIAVKGKVNNSTRTRVFYMRHGSFAISTFKKSMSFAMGISHARTGSFSIKNWVYFTP